MNFDDYTKNIVKIREEIVQVCNLTDGKYFQITKAYGGSTNI
jgi:hypothetical protein